LPGFDGLSLGQRACRLADLIDNRRYHRGPVIDGTSRPAA
jgi:hypothetical protein